MATLHVSQTATNGYSVGNNFTADGTKALPYLTLEAALTAAANDDTIVINDGTYDAASFFDIANSGLTINPENDYLTTLTSVNTTRVIYINTGGDNLTLGKLIVDGEDTTANCINGTTSNDTDSLTLNGTYLDNPTQWAVTFTRLAALTMHNGWRCTGATPFGIVNCDASAVVGTVGAFNIYDGSCSLTNMTNSNARAIWLLGAAGMSTKIYNNEFTCTVASGTNLTEAIELNGVPSVDVYSNTITRTGGVDYLTGIVVRNSTVACTHCYVYDNTLVLDTDAQSTATYGIRIGEEESTNANSITDCKVWGNSVKGTNHGVMLGFVTGAVAEENTVDYAVIGLLAKGTNNCRMNGSLLKHITTQHLYNKYGTNDSMSNNTCVLSSGYIGIPMYSGPDGANQTTNTTYVNNICYSDATINKWVQADGTSTLTDLSTNHFYSSVALPANPFHWNGTNYADLAAFETAVSGAANNLETDPLMNADYSLTVSSPCVGTGKRWWTGANPVGSDGEPFSDIDTDIGGIQSTHGPFHPRNL